MTTLTEIMQATYRKIGQLTVTNLTGGTTLTAIDTKLSGKFKSNEWKDGVMFVEKTTDGLAPQGEFQRISAYANTNTTFTVDTAFSLTLGAGDIVAFASSDFPSLMMIEWVNDALRVLGDIVLIDSSSLTYDPATAEYSLPAAWKDLKPYRVDIYDGTQWLTVPESTWKYLPPATFTVLASAQAKIVLPFSYWSAGALRVWYHGKHPSVSAYGDLISDAIDPELLCLASAEAALEWYNAANSGGDNFIVARLNEVRQLRAEREARYPILRPRKTTKTMPMP